MFLITNKPKNFLTFQSFNTKKQNMTTQQEIACSLEFKTKLSELLESIQEKTLSQFEYNLQYNIPEKIGDITYSSAAQHAINTGVVSAINQMFSWDCEEAVRFAYKILEDANCHAEAKELVKFIPEYQ